MSTIKDKSLKIRILKSSVSYKKIDLNNDISFDLATSACVDKSNKIVLSNNSLAVQCCIKPLITGLIYQGLYLYP